jgi:LPS export ABC transporter protein LptC
MTNRLTIRRVLALFIGLSTLVLMVVGTRHLTKGARPEKALPSLPGGVDLALTTLHFTESEAGQMRWELAAASGHYNRSGDSSVLKDLRLNVYRTPALGPITVSARDGVYQHGSKNIQLAGDVRASSAKGLSFSTERLEYEAADRRFHTSEKVLLQDGALRVEGEGMELFVDKQVARVGSRVSATIDPGMRRP